MMYAYACTALGGCARRPRCSLVTGASYARTYPYYGVRHMLAGRHVIHWIDNESAVYSLAKGYSGAADSARVVNLYHACVAQLRVTPWLEYVHTDDNIADLPSRGEYGLLQTLGGSGSFRVAVIPSSSSFVGPLAPLFGAKSNN